MGLGLGLRRRVWPTALVVLPQGLVAALWHRSRSRRPRGGSRAVAGVRALPACGGRLEVAWAEVPGVGSGPSAILFLADEQVMRFDCFGGDEGHMHVNPDQDELLAQRTWQMPRLYFGPGTRADHVRRAGFELRRNTAAGVAGNLRRRVLDTRLDPDELDAAAAWMVEEMLAMLAHGAAPTSEAAAG